MLVDEIDQTVNGFLFRDIEFHRLFAYVEVDLAWRAPYIAEIGIGHFTRAIHDASHHRDTDALQVAGSLANLLCGDLQVEECAATTRAGYIVGLEDACSGSLQNVVADAQALPRGILALDQDGIPDSITEEGTDIAGCRQQGGEEVLI